MSTLITLVKALRDLPETSEESGFSEHQQVKLATTIAMSLKIPTSVEAESGNLFFNNHYRAPVRRMISEINELFLLNCPAVESLVEKVYIERFNFVHRPELTTDSVSAIINSIPSGFETAKPVRIEPVDLARLNTVVKPMVSEVLEVTTN